MTSWTKSESHGVLSIGKRLGFLLAVVAVYCVAVRLVISYWKVDVLAWSGATSLIDTIILGLLMSFRNRVAYDRWWEARSLWGQLTNDSRNLSLKLAAFLPTDVISKDRAGEMLIAFPEALKRHLRDESLHLRDLAGFENQSTEPVHVPLYISGRLFSMVANWQREGYVDQTQLWILDPHLRGLMDVCGACEKIRNTPLSPSYKSLLRAGLVLNILAAPWLTFPEIGFWGVPLVELVCFFLLGVELIDSVIEEPFGHEHEDLDLDRYCETIRNSVRATLPISSYQSTAGSP